MRLASLLLAFCCGVMLFESCGVDLGFRASLQCGTPLSHAFENFAPPERPFGVPRASFGCCVGTFEVLEAPVTETVLIGLETSGHPGTYLLFIRKSCLRDCVSFKQFRAIQ